MVDSISRQRCMESVACLMTIMSVHNEKEEVRQEGTQMYSLRRERVPTTLVLQAKIVLKVTRK